jgi:NAD(P)-dependent dehydrogenase (short-subunit alcohol dehydrogenase family)
VTVGPPVGHPHTVVTGASSGIGRATALRLAASGQHVFAGVRKTADAESLRAEASGELTSLLLDVTDPEQINQARELVAGHVGGAGLSGLVDNAGIGMAWPLELVPLDAVRQQFEVNVFGQLAVVQAFLPLLRQARGRVVVIGSIGDRLTMPFAGVLCASKAAVASLAEGLRQELAPWDVRVVLVEPASIHTEAVDKLERDAHSAVENFPPGGRELYQDAYQRMIRTFAAGEREGSAPEVVADTILRALSARRPRARYLVGKDARRLATLAVLAPTGMFDAFRRRLFGLPAPGSRAV